MFWQNFSRLCDGVGKSPNRVAADLGLSNSVATNWKRGAMPRDNVLRQIADYFGVPVETLTVDAPSPAALTSGETEILRYFRNFTREGQGRLLDFAESMKRSGMYEPGVDYFARGMDAEPY